MAKRGLTRQAFGKRIANLGKNTELVAKARIEIEAMRMMVLKAAKAMDVLGNAQARVWVSAVKAMVPERVCRILDDAIQIHGVTGVSHWTPLADMYASQRTLRLADGPDEREGQLPRAPGDGPGLRGAVNALRTAAPARPSVGAVGRGGALRRLARLHHWMHTDADENYPESR